MIARAVTLATSLALLAACQEPKDPYEPDGRIGDGLTTTEAAPPLDPPTR